MITFLEGMVVEKDPTRVVLNVGGVGYEVFIPLSSYDHLPAPGDACKILTYDHVREDVHALYGFLTAEERRMFLMLLNISGCCRMAGLIFWNCSPRQRRSWASRCRVSTGCG